MLRKKIVLNKIFYIILFLFLIQTGFVYGEDRPTLKFGYSSSENPSVLIDRMTPLMNIMSEALDADIDFVHKKTFSEMQKAFINQEIDFGIINAYSLIRILPYASVIPIAARVIHNSREYQTYFFTRKDSEIYEIDDLRGKSVALGDPYSTSSYLIPHFLFKQNGILPDTDFKETIIISKQDSLIYAVLNHTADAGVAASFIFNEQDEEIKSMLKVFSMSETFPLGPFIVNKNMQPSFIARIKDVLLTLNDTDIGKAALEIAEIEGFEEVNIDDYQPLIEIVNSMNIN